jgi:hypothetical protein
VRWYCSLMERLPLRVARTGSSDTFAGSTAMSSTAFELKIHAGGGEINRPRQRSRLT